MGQTLVIAPLISAHKPWLTFRHLSPLVGSFKFVQPRLASFGTAKHKCRGRVFQTIPTQSILWLLLIELIYEVDVSISL